MPGPRTISIQDLFGYPSEGLWNPASRKGFPSRALTKTRTGGRWPGPLRRAPALPGASRPAARVPARRGPAAARGSRRCRRPPEGSARKQIPKSSVPPLRKMSMFCSVFWPRDTGAYSYQVLGICPKFHTLCRSQCPILYGKAPTKRNAAQPHREA